MGYILANKLVIMSIYTHNWESVMNFNNRMLNIAKKNKKRRKRKKTDKKKRFFHKKKTVFIEIKNQKIKNRFLYNTSSGVRESERKWWMKILFVLKVTKITLNAYRFLWHPFLHRLLSLFGPSLRLCNVWPKFRF